MNAETAPLLRLPGELRNKIYACVFEGQLYVRSFKKPRYNGSGCSGLQLLHVCRQIRHETSLLASESVFCLQLHEAPTGPSTQYFDFPRFPNVRLENISMLLLVTMGYREWSNSRQTEFAGLQGINDAEFLIDLPNIKHVEVLGLIDNVEDEVRLQQQSAVLDRCSSHLRQLLKTQRPDIEITFQAALPPEVTRRE